MTETLDISTLEQKLGHIDSEVIKIISRGLSETSKGESVEEISTSVLEEKKICIEGPELTRRIENWGANGLGVEEVRKRIISNLSDRKLLLLSDEDNQALDQLHLQYNCLVQNIPVPNDFISPFGCSLIHDDETVPPSLRKYIVMRDSSTAGRLKIVLHHEIGHLGASGVFSNLLTPNSKLPKAHSTSDPHGKDLEGFVDYLSEVDEIDVRTRATISFLSDTWNPTQRPATQTQVNQIREAGRWSVPPEVRELREHFNDDEIIWMLNSMPAI
jgi:hypothetical protein